MKRTPSIIAILAVALALAAATVPGYSRIVSSAQSFGYYFRAMQTTAGSLGPVERFAYSVILAQNQPAQRHK